MKKKIPIKNKKSPFSVIIKRKLDEKQISTWKELTDLIGIDNPRTFIDFFNGKQCIKKEDIDKLFEVLELSEEIKEIYLEPVIKYKLKTNIEEINMKENEYKDLIELLKYECDKYNKKQIKDKKQYNHEYYLKVTKPKRKIKE